MFHLIADVLLTILAPILLMVLIGAVLRWKLHIDIKTLGKLNIYLFVPVYVFEYVSNSKLKWEEMVGIFGITVVQVLTLGLIVWGGMKKGLVVLLRLPILPGLAAGILAQWMIKHGHPLPVAISKISRYLADVLGYVPGSGGWTGGFAQSGARAPDRWRAGWVLCAETADSGGWALAGTVHDEDDQRGEVFGGLA